MGRSLDEHLDHILEEVVPSRGAAQDGLTLDYITEVEARPQPPHLIRGLEQWNAGRFYEQHETLEWLWRATSDPVRDALKGIIQSGVGAYHVLNNNRRGALGKWTGAIGYLEPFADAHPYGIDIGDLRRQVLELRRHLLDTKNPDWPTLHDRVRRMQVRWEADIAEPAVTALLRRVDRAWQDSSVSLEATLEELSEGEASWSPAPNTLTIRAHLRNIGARKAVAANRCFGDGTLEMDDAEADAPDRWRKFKRWLVDMHEELREPVGFLRDNQLHDMRAMPAGTLDIEHIIEDNIEHDFYDAGRLALLREQYRRLTSDGGTL